MDQAKLRNLILWKQGDDGPVAYNDRLREIDGLLTRYKYSDEELKLLEQDIYNSLPEWRRKQMTREREDKRG